MTPAYETIPYAALPAVLGVRPTLPVFYHDAGGRLTAYVPREFSLAWIEALHVRLAREYCTGPVRMMLVSQVPAEALWLPEDA